MCQSDFQVFIICHMSHNLNFLREIVLGIILTSISGLDDGSCLQGGLVHIGCCANEGSGSRAYGLGLRVPRLGRLFQRTAVNLKNLNILLTLKP